MSDRRLNSSGGNTLSFKNEDKGSITIARDDNLHVIHGLGTDVMSSEVERNNLSILYTY